jgi:hypothetical protein
MINTLRRCSHPQITLLQYKNSFKIKTQIVTTTEKDIMKMILRIQINLKMTVQKITKSKTLLIPKLFNHQSTWPRLILQGLEKTQITNNKIKKYN